MENSHEHDHERDLVNAHEVQMCLDQIESLALAEQAEDEEFQRQAGYPIPPMTGTTRTYTYIIEEIYG